MFLKVIKRFKHIFRELSTFCEQLVDKVDEDVHIKSKIFKILWVNSQINVNVFTGCE